MSALDELARRCGIQESALDARGNQHITTPEMKRALLEAMRLDVSDDASTQAALEKLEAREWDRALPPVLVVYSEGAPINVPVTLPADTENVQWTLTAEDGTETSGAARFSDMKRLGSRNHNGLKLKRRSLVLPDEVPWGYHQFCLADSGEEPTKLIVSPGKCWLPDPCDGHFWGLAVQLYLLRSKHNWGIGDFTDLRELVTLAKGRGADCIGLNPLHAMFLDRPADASPYSPSDRVLLNVLNIDVEAVPEFAQSEAAQKFIASSDFQQRLQAGRDSALVDYDTAAELKLQILRLLFATFEAQQDPARMEAFDAFHNERRELLDRACLFQALREYFTSKDSALCDCHDWPEEYRTSQSPAVEEFAQQRAEFVRFHLWLQWIADTQLGAAAEAAKGMAIGLYRDLAVGAHPSGAEVWSHPETLVSGASVGAPPDIWNPAGQNWGLPPLHPQAAREHGYQGFIELVRANMRYAGALRIDHAMALQRLYWIPKGKEPKDGAYVQYPTDDLIGILALESHRNRCMVIGEDLGTVPAGFCESMAKANILSYRVLFFERDKDGFFSPDKYPYLALSVASNHDLPTLRGWWQDLDLDLKQELNLFPEGPETARKEREADREFLLQTMRQAGLLDDKQDISVDEFCDAAHCFLAATDCLLTLVQIDDITEEADQVNVPSTSGEHPNWRRRLSLTLEELAADPRFDSVVKSMSDARSSSRMRAT